MAFVRLTRLAGEKGREGGSSKTEKKGGPSSSTPGRLAKTSSREKWGAKKKEEKGKIKNAGVLLNYDANNLPVLCYCVRLMTGKSV